MTGGFAVVTRLRADRPTHWIVKCVVGSHDEAKAVLEGMSLALDSRIVPLPLPCALIISSVVFNEMRVQACEREFAASHPDRPTPEEWR